MTDATKSPKPRRHHRKKRKDTPPWRKESFRTQYYFTKGHEHLGEAINVYNQQSPFLYPSCSLMFSYFQYWKTKKRQQRQSASKKAEELLRSLRVDVDIEALIRKTHKDPDEMIAITDVDPQYFTELDGRPVKEKFSVKQYVEDTREIFRTKLLAGQEMDDCIRIDQQFVLEQKKMDTIKHRYHQYVSGFEEFLSKDHEESMKILLQADEEARRTNEITCERNRLAKEFGQVRLEVYNGEESWRMVKMCQRFLYQVSPIAWREEHDWIHRSASGENVTSSSTENLFGRYKMTDDATPLDVLIELFEQDTDEAGPTEMYFEDPFELIRVFRTIEIQNLNALIHLESLAKPMSEMMTTIEAAEKQIQLRVNELNSAIAEVQTAIDRLESRAEELEKYANKLLEGVFREAVCSDEVLRFQVFIENAYESCVGPNDANLDSFSMMKWIEKTHEDLNLELDTLPPEVVLACEREGFRQELKAMKETEEAAKKYELMYRLLGAMKRIMEPPVIKGRPLVWRSVPATQKMKAKPPTPVPTEEEMQYLTYFTRFCQQEDFTKYRSQFPDDFNLSFRVKRRDRPERSSDGSDTIIDDKSSITSGIIDEETSSSKSSED